MINKLWDNDDFRIVKWIKEYGHTSPYALSKKLNLNNSTVYNKISVLLSHKLLKETSDKILSVTELGEMVIVNIKSEPVKRSFSSNELGYRIANENGTVQIVIVFHGTVSPGSKISCEKQD